MNDTVEAATQGRKSLGRAKEAVIAAGALFRLRSPALELSLRRVEAGSAAARDYSRLERLNDPRRISRAITALQDASAAPTAENEELEAKLAVRLVTNGAERERARMAFIAGGSGALAGFCTTPFLGFGAGSAAVFLGSVLAIIGFNSKTLKAVERVAGELLLRQGKHELSDETKAALAFRAPMDAIREAGARASGRTAAVLARCVERREADEACNRLMTARGIDEREEEELVRKVCEQGTGEQAKSLYLSRKAVSSASLSMLDGRLH